MAQVTMAQGAQFDTSLALRAKVLSLYSLDTNSDAVRIDAKTFLLSPTSRSRIPVYAADLLWDRAQQ